MSNFIYFKNPDKSICSNCDLYFQEDNVCGFSLNQLSLFKPDNTKSEWTNFINKYYDDSESEGKIPAEKLNQAINILDKLNRTDKVTSLKNLILCAIKNKSSFYID